MLIKKRIRKKDLVHHECPLTELLQEKILTLVTEEDYFDPSTKAINLAALTHGWVKAQKRKVSNNDSKINLPKDLGKA